MLLVRTAPRELVLKGPGELVGLHGYTVHFRSKRVILLVIVGPPHVWWSWDNLLVFVQKNDEGVSVASAERLF